MKINEAVKISIIATILIVALSIPYYFVIFLPRTNTANNTDVIGNILKCNELYELKKIGYWDDEIGQSKTIYNEDLDTCLALNIYNNFQTDEYFAMIMDMSDDSIIMYYSSTPQGFYVEGDERITCKENYIYFKFVQNGKTVKEYGCDTDEEGIIADQFGLFDKMLEKVRSFGFKIFDGFGFK
jgi:hypothetical protein